MTRQPRIPASKARVAIFAAGMAVASSISWAQMTEPYASYTVTAADTVQTLSRTLLNDPTQWANLARLNRMANANALQAGQVLQIPKSLLNFNSQPRITVQGVVKSTIGDVKIGGQTILAGAVVSEGSRIETSANGSAVVELADGSRMQLMPKTLAEVTSQHGYALRDPSSSASTTWFSGAIRLVSGVLDTLANKQANRATPLNIITATSVVGVRGTQFRVAYEDPASGAARTEVLEGKVQADNPTQGATASLNTGFGAAVKRDEREIKVVALLPAMPSGQLPQEILRIVGSRNEPEQAMWTVGLVKGASGYRAQFASDAKFNELEGDVKSNSNTMDVTGIRNGSYYARVRGFDAAGIEGYDAVQQVVIKTAAPQPSLVWPRQIGTDAIAEYVRGGVVLSINRSSADTPQSLTVQIARDAAFTQGLESMLTTANGTALLRSPPAGQRSFVRFAGTSPEGLAAISPTFTLDIPRNWGSAVLSMSPALQPLR
jgi:hypothetical protein